MQDAVDDTLVLKERLASVGGLSAFQAEAGTSLGLPLHTLEPALSKVSLYRVSSFPLSFIVVSWHIPTVRCWIRCLPHRQINIGLWL